MGHEKSDPKVGVIAKIGIIAIVTVLGIRFGLISYFSWMNDKEQFTKVGSLKTQQLDDLRQDEAKRLNGGPMPIASSMKMLAADKRLVPGLEPKQADPMREKETMSGWKQMPHALAEEADAAVPAPPASATAGDAAAAAMVDAATRAVIDGGAPPPHNPNEHH